MAYKKTDHMLRASMPKGTTGAAGPATMSNTGLSFIENATTAQDVYVLERPVLGCQKRLVFIDAKTTAGELPVVRCSTTGADDITFSGATTGLNVMTLTTARIVAQHVVVDLVGLSSIAWAIASVYPPTSVAVTPVALSSG
jgi:hypothetical protein